MAWKKIPIGTRVRNRSKGYGGWITGWTDDRLKFEDQRVNPDGTQCRIYIHQDHRYRLACEEDLEVCDGTAEIMDVSKLDEKLIFPIGSEDFSSMPIFCRIWTMGWYHARYMLKSSRVKDLTHTNRLEPISKLLEQHHDGGKLDKP